MYEAYRAMAPIGFRSVRSMRGWVKSCSFVVDNPSSASYRALRPVQTRRISSNTVSLNPVVGADSCSDVDPVFDTSPHPGRVSSSLTDCAFNPAESTGDYSRHTPHTYVFRSASAITLYQLAGVCRRQSLATFTRVAEARSQPDRILQPGCGNQDHDFGQGAGWWEFV